MDEIENRGTWFIYPSFLEVPPGPWCKRPVIGRMDIVEGWKDAIDWMADHELNVLVGEIPPAEKAEVRQGWGYHYILDFEDFPEARVFSSEFTERNRKILNEIASYAKEKGIKLFIEHYNFLAPNGLVTKHTSIAEKLLLTMQRGVGRAYEDATGLLHGNISWNTPIYKKFMKACWDELFRKCPDISGIMITVGECANSQDHLSRRDITDSEGISNNDKMRVDFIETFKNEMYRHGKIPLVRSWMSRRAIGLFPKDVTYIIKQQLSDCVDVGPDPLVKEWINEGYTVWVSKEIYGENAGPIIWANPEYLWRQCRYARELNVDGVLALHNTQRSFRGFVTKLQQVNYVAFTYYLSHNEPYNESLWKRHFEEIFGRIGGRVLEAMKKASLPILNISRIIYTKDEGYTYDFPYPIIYKISGYKFYLGSEHMRPPEWIRGDLQAIHDYIEEIKRSGWKESLLSEPTKGKMKNPIAFLSSITEESKEGAEILEELSRKETKSPDDLELARINAWLSYYLGLEWIETLKAYLYYNGGLHEKKEEEKKELFNKCLKHLSKAIEALERQMELLLSFPQHLIEPAPTFIKGISAAPRFTISITEKIEMRRREYLQLKSDFEIQKTEEEKNMERLIPWIDRLMKEVYRSIVHKY